MELFGVSESDTASENVPLPLLLWGNSCEPQSQSQSQSQPHANTNGQSVIAVDTKTGQNLWHLCLPSSAVSAFAVLPTQWSQSHTLTHSLTHLLTHLFEFF